MPNYYVKPTGNNGDTGLSWDHAWQTITYAAAQGVGTFFVLGNNTYNESAPGAQFYSTWIGSDGSGGNALVTINGGGGANEFFLFYGQYTYAYFRFTNFGNVHCMGDTDVESYSFNNCSFDHLVGGLILDGPILDGTALHISDCDYYENGSGIKFDGICEVGETFLYLNWCRFWNNNTNGVDSSSAITEIINCTFYNNTAQDINCAGSITNCIFSSSPIALLRAGGTTDINYNCFYNTIAVKDGVNEYDYNNVNGWGNTGNIGDNPQFRNPADPPLGFKLKGATSPCDGTGDGGDDMGAYENLPPTLSNLVDYTGQTKIGEVLLTVDLSDAELDQCELLVEFTIDAGENWANCMISDDPTKTDGTVNNAVPPGTPQITALTPGAGIKATWFSAADIPSAIETVQVRVKSKG